MDILAKYDESNVASLRTAVESELKDLEGYNLIAFRSGQAYGMLDALNEVILNIKKNDGKGVDINDLGADLVIKALRLLGETL